MRKGRASQRAIAWPPSRIQRVHWIEDINPDTTEIFLSDNSIGTHGAQVLARTLQECKNLTTLELCNNSIGTQGAQALARALQECKNLTTLNLYNNSIGTQGGQALARTLQECKNLTTLILSDNSIGTHGAQVLARALQECKNLTTLELCNNSIGTQGAQALARAFQECKNLTKLLLSDNSIGTQDAQALARTLQECKNLTTLELCNNSIGTQGAQALARALQECKNLTILNFYNNSIGTQGAQALARTLQECKNLTTLVLSRNNIGTQGAQALARALQECKNLTTLNLYDNSIGTQGAQALARALQECKNLTTLNLSRNNIGTQGAQALARALQECKNLTTLLLSDNSIGTQDAQALARTLQECKNLTTLELCNNSIGTQGAQALARALQECKNLTILNLYNNSIGTQGAQALARTLQECKNLTTLVLSDNSIGTHGAQVLARALQECKNLTTLELCNNSIGTQGAQALARAFQECKNLTKLLLSDNSIGTQDAQALARTLQECKNLTTLELCNNSIGTQGAQALARALQECKNLTILNFYNNSIGTQGAQALARTLQECKNLTTLVLSRNNIGTQGAQALARALQECKNLTTLNLYDNSIGTQGAQALARALQECKNLTTLNLSRNNIGTQGAQALARALQECKNLTTLLLSDNSIGTQDAQALARTLQECKNLTTLELCNNSIGTQGAQALARALQECKNLTILNFYNNSIGTQGAQALARTLQECKNLTTLVLSRNNIGTQGAQALARALQECKNLTTLNLYDNSIGTQGAQALARALQECKNLTTLNLSRNNIGTQGAQALARALQECKNLTTLLLSDNSIGTQDAQALARTLQECKNLTTLELCNNSIGTQGAQALARALQECKNLTILNLYNNSIGTQGAQALARTLQECKNLTTLVLSDNSIGTHGAQVLARALQECKNLTTLELCNNSIGTQGAQALARALQECKNLTTLDLSSNNIGTEDAQALAIALKECKNLTTVWLYPVSKMAEQPTIRTRVRTGVTAVVAQVLWFLNLTLSSGQFFVFRFVLVLGICMQCIGISSLRAITLVIQLDLFPCLLRYVSFVVSFCIVFVVWFCTWLWSFHSSNKTTEDLKKTKDTAGNRNLNANADLLDNVLKNFKMKLGKENSDCRVSLGSGDDFLNDGITLLEEFASPSVQKYILQMKLQQTFRDIMKSKTSLETLQDQIRASSQHRLSSLVEQRNNKRNQLRALLIIVYSYLRAGRDNIHEHYDADVMRVFKVKLDSLLDRLDTIDGLSAAQNIDGNILDCLRNLVGRAKLCVKAYRLNKIGRLSDMEEPSNVISKRVRSGESELGQGDTSYRDARAREGTAAFECKLLYIQSMLQEDKLVAEVAEILWSVGCILQQLESAETIKLSNSTRPSLKIFMEIKDYVQLGMREPDVDHLKNLYKQLTDSRNAMEGLKRAKADLEAEESEEEKVQCRSRIARHEGVLAKGTPIELSELFRHKVAETLRLAQIHYPELLKNQEWLELLHISAEGLLEVACSGLWLATVNTSDFQPVGEPLASRGGKKVRKVLNNAGRTLVLKEFLLGHSSQSKTFYKQVTNLDKVVSQHVIRIKSAFIDSSGEDLRGCIIMPFYEQGDLAKWIAEHSKEGKAVRDRLAIGLLAGVADLHANGIVHCDIKPENIFLTNNGTPLLGDFDGIKIADCTATYTSFQATPGYIAPELQNGRIDKFTAKIDMYSVGVVLQDLYPAPAAAMRQLIDSLKAIDPNLRPSAREALQHNAFGAVEVRVETCLICMERVQFSEGTSCENGDFLCRDCIASSVAAAAQPQASVKVDASGTMLCTKPGCNGRIFGRDIARLAPDALNHLLRIVRMRVESKAAVWAEQEIRRRLDQIRRADGLTRDAQRHLLYIQENILNSCCPNCSACFDHFNGCCAVKCGQDGCNHNFCAWCLEYSSQDSDACHRHVRHCPRKRGQDPYFPDSFEQVREAWQLLRAERLRDYWNTHIQDRYLQGVLRKQLAPFLTQDIIGPNFSLQ